MQADLGEQLDREENVLHVEVLLKKSETSKAKRSNDPRNSITVVQRYLHVHDKTQLDNQSRTLVKMMR